MSILSGVNGVVRDLVGSGDYQVATGSFMDDPKYPSYTSVALPFMPKLVIVGTDLSDYTAPYCLFRGGYFQIDWNDSGGSRLIVSSENFLDENGFRCPIRASDIVNYFAIG